MENKLNTNAVKILRSERDFVLLCKAPGQECEHEIPELLAQALGGKAENYYCVHRLDRAVGGVMVYARTAKTAAALSAQIQAHGLQKEYFAVVQGCPAQEQGILQDYLYHDKRKGKAFPVKSLRKGVKEAELEYKCLASAPVQGSTASLVWVRLHTGRFHQIRAQFAARKMPLLGDGRYGSREKGCGIALFSCKIGFDSPAGSQRITASQMPPEQFPWNLFEWELYNVINTEKKEG